MTRYRTIVADPPWPLDAFPPTAEYKVCPLPYDTMSVADIKDIDVGRFAALGCHLYLWTTNGYLWAARDVAEAWGFSFSCVLTWCKPPSRHGVGMGGKFASTTEFVLFCRDFEGIRKVTAYLADCAASRGIGTSDVDRRFGTNGMAGHWLSRSSQPALPTPDRWNDLKAFIGADDRFDEEFDAYHRFKGNQPRVNTRWFEWPRARHSEKPEAFLDLVEQVSPGPYLELFARRQRLGWDTWGNEALEHVTLAAVGGPTA